MAETTPISLEGMPEDVMRIIIEKCDFVAIQCLRKTCHTIRNFIDDCKPEQSIDIIEITNSPEKISLVFHENDDFKLPPDGGRIYIGYQKLEEKNTKVTWYRNDKNREKIISNQNFSDSFFLDFGLLLECKLPILEKLFVNWDGILGKLQFKNSPIKVKTLCIANTTCQENILDVLPYVCPDALKILAITCAEGANEIWDLSKIVELEQWKKAEELRMDGEPVWPGVQNIKHFSYAEVELDVVNLEDMLALKELFLHTSSISKQFRINFQQLSNEAAFIQQFGPPIERPVSFYDVRSKTLYFEKPGDNENMVTIGFFERFFEFNIIKNYNNTTFIQ